MYPSCLSFKDKWKVLSPKLTPIVEPVLLYQIVKDLFWKSAVCHKSHTLIGTTVDEEQTLELIKTYVVVWM